MRTVQRYTLPEQLECVIEVSLPRDAVVLDCGVLADAPVMWVEVDPEARLGPRAFWLMRTGREGPTMPIRFIGSMQFTPTVNRPLCVGVEPIVLHLYEVEHV